MTKKVHAWNDEFPLDEEVEDHSGKMRAFTISCHDTGLGFTVRAVEKKRQGSGYEFASYSETSPYHALGRLREEMRRALATRHITGAPGRRRMMHNQLCGRIAVDRLGGVSFVVDGVPISMDDLQSILESHEGWNFELTIASALQ